MNFHNVIDSLKAEIERTKLHLVDLKIITSFEEYNYRVGYLNGLLKAYNLLTTPTNTDIYDNN